MSGFASGIVDFLIDYVTYFENPYCYLKKLLKDIGNSSKKKNKGDRYAKKICLSNNSEIHDEAQITAGRVCSTGFIMPAKLG